MTTYQSNLMMGTAAVMPMGRANHSERPVPKRPPLLAGAAGAVSDASSSRRDEVWKDRTCGAWHEGHGLGHAEASARRRL